MSQERNAGGNNDGYNATINTATQSNIPRKAPQRRKHGNGGNMTAKGFLMGPHWLAFISSAMRYCICTNVIVGCRFVVAGLRLPVREAEAESGFAAFSGPLEAAHFIMARP